MDTKFFEDFEVDETMETHGRTITEADQSNFAGVGGTFHPMHMDDEYMADTEYGERVVYGLLQLAVAEGLRTQLGILDDSAMAYYGIDNVRFTAPLYIGETVTNRITVLETIDRDEDNGIVVLNEELRTQDGETVMVADSRLLVRKRE